MSETIDRAAIHYDEIVYSVPRPGRHGDVIKLMRGAGLPRITVNLLNQGFTTHSGVFVNREAAYIIAKDSGQLRGDGSFPGTLFTEDLW